MRTALLALVPAMLAWASPAPARAPAEPSPAAALAALRGDVTVVAFWASWCPPCLAELPRLEALQKRLPAGVRVVAVSVDKRGKPAATARAAFAERNLTLPLIVDGGAALYERYFKRRELVVPRLVVIDRADHGLQSSGFAPDVTTDDFIHEILDAVDKVRGARAAAPAGWRPLR